MIVADSSALVAIALDEPEAFVFSKAVTISDVLIGAPTAVEATIVVNMRNTAAARGTLDAIFAMPNVKIVAFGAAEFARAADAFARYGRGQGHPARLNYGDCMSYAVARERDLPLLYKGDDFAHTDIRSALPLFIP